MDTAPEGRRNGIGQRTQTTLQHPSGVPDCRGQAPGALPPAKFRRPSGPDPRRTPRQRGDRGEGKGDALAHEEGLCPRITRINANGRPALVVRSGFSFACIRVIRGPPSSMLVGSVVVPLLQRAGDAFKGAFGVYQVLFGFGHVVQHTVSPPFTCSVCPVTKDDASLARKTTEPSRSEGMPQRLTGMSAR